jgi:hypothetical protein
MPSTLKVYAMVDFVSGTLFSSEEDFFGPWQAKKKGITNSKTLIADRLISLLIGLSVDFSIMKVERIFNIYKRNFVEY